MGRILTDSKRLNVAIILLLINCIIILLVGVIYAIMGTFMPYHIEYTGLTESDVDAYSSKLMNLISVTVRLLGVLTICIGYTGITIILYGIREKRKWAWFWFLITYFAALMPLLAITLFITGFFGTAFLLFVIVAIFWTIAQFISYKEIFK